MTATKQALRENVWQAMQDAGVDRFPGATDRIPNFNGAKEAAHYPERLTYIQPACRHSVE